ncbi:hypothetical protein NM688_g8894 [Phlebia brevispora]|uniref:Uncharacterized protein n=1 Tax=Phlebia brevispora TaxID=194682 RepID=A0ACC1RPB3_9APHY|nr:hypothetical protein NM688_g8894 [Phlebia brevispora]
MDHLYKSVDAVAEWATLHSRTVLILAALPLVYGSVTYLQRGRRSRSSSGAGRNALGVTNIYDVVIVGGGTAGCVLASRLTEDPSISVLLLEAGTSAKGLQFAEVPVALIRFVRSKWDFGLYTEPQAHAAGRKCMWPQAKLLGGCSNVNAMIVQYGAPSDYDEWARLQRGQPGASEWVYDSFKQYFRKFEKFNPSKKFPYVDRTQHGADGPFDIGYDGHYSKLTSMFVQSCERSGIPRSHDFNTALGTLGTSETMTYIKPDGRRITTEIAYLTPEVLAKSNLKVVTQASVTRVLVDKAAAGVRAVGAEYKLPDGLIYTVKASQEVAVCAGAIFTPKILMLSGIGPAEHLSPFGIPVVANIPGVGSHLKDHLVVDLAYMDKTRQSLSYLAPVTLTQRLRAFGATAQYLLTGKGPLTSNIGEALAFARSDDPNLFPSEGFSVSTVPEDTTSGQDAPDIEIFFSPMAYIEHATKPGPSNGKYTFMQHIVLLRLTEDVRNDTLTLREP